MGSYLGKPAPGRCDGEHKFALSKIADVPVGRAFLNPRSDWGHTHDTRIRVLNRHSAWGPWKRPGARQKNAFQKSAFVCRASHRPDGHLHRVLVMERAVGA